MKKDLFRFPKQVLQRVKKVHVKQQPGAASV